MKFIGRIPGNTQYGFLALFAIIFNTDRFLHVQVQVLSYCTFVHQFDACNWAVTSVASLLSRGPPSRPVDSCCRCLSVLRSPVTTRVGLVSRMCISARCVRRCFPVRGFYACVLL